MYSINYVINLTSIMNWIKFRGPDKDPAKRLSIVKYMDVRAT